MVASRSRLGPMKRCPRRRWIKKAPADHTWVASLLYNYNRSTYLRDDSMMAMRTLLSRHGEPNRRVRRVIVLVSVAANPITVAAVMVIARARWPLPVGLLAFVAPLVLVSIPLLVLSEFRRNVIRGSHPDERERQRRDEAYRISYRIVEVSVPLGLFVVFLFRDQVAAIWSYDWFLIYWPLFGYLIFLPYAVFAWREPDAVD